MKQNLTIEIICILLILLFVTSTKLIVFKLFIGDVYDEFIPVYKKQILIWDFPFIEFEIANFLIFEKSLWRHSLFQRSISAALN